MWPNMTQKAELSVTIRGMFFEEMERSMFTGQVCALLITLPLQYDTASLFSKLALLTLFHFDVTNYLYYRVCAF